MLEQTLFKIIVICKHAMIPTSLLEHSIFFPKKNEEAKTEPQHNLALAFKIKICPYSVILIDQEKKKSI